MSRDHFRSAVSPVERPNEGLNRVEPLNAHAWFVHKRRGGADLRTMAMPYKVVIGLK